MNSLSKQELTIILAYYYFDSKKSTTNTMTSFNLKFNMTFNRDFSNQILTYYCSLFKNVDPSFNAKPIPNEELRINELWDYYITQDRIKDLKMIYKNFKQGLIEKKFVNIENDVFDNINEYISKDIKNLHFSFLGDKVKKLYNSSNATNVTQSIRDLSVSFNALSLADFKCEVDNNHKTFMRKNIEIPYTEGHHIIPLKYQYMFNINLDVEANVVSLCSNCHNKLHYGRDFEELLVKIFTDERKKRLEKCGIVITLEELISFYK